MTPNLAKCLLVAKVLIADGMITDDERTFLETLMNELGLSKEDRDRVISLDGMDDATAYVQKLSVDERRDLVTRLFDAASADGHLSPLEMATMKKVKAALGV